MEEAHLTKTVPLGVPDDHIVTIEACLPEELKAALIAFFKENGDVFARESLDLPKIPGKSLNIT